MLFTAFRDENNASKVLRRFMMAQEIKKADQTAQPTVRSGDVFSELRGEIDRLFDSFTSRGRGVFPSLFGTEGASAPRVDIKEDEKSLRVEAEIPGMEEKDINISLRDGVLTLKGEKKTERDEEKDNFHISERRYGSFERSFRVPDSIDEDKVNATVDKGVLRVMLPKKADAVKPARQIPIGKA